MKYSHHTGVFDVGLKGAVADLASRYAKDLPQQMEAADEDAAAVYEYDCVLKRQFGQRDREAGCAGARSTRASLLPKVSAGRSQLLDVSALTGQSRRLGTDEQMTGGRPVK